MNGMNYQFELDMEDNTFNILALDGLWQLGVKEIQVLRIRVPPKSKGEEIL